jgi:ribosomal-protein-alanine N-acetyltransferase
MPKTLRTSRLRLRPFRREDLAEIAAYLSDPGFTRHLSPDFPDAERLVANNTSLDWSRQCGFAIEFEGAVVGSVHLGREAGESEGELACLIAPPFQRRGFAAEASAAVIDYALRELGIEVVRARADARNTASIRGMEKLGMRPLGRRPGRIDRSGARVDEVVYILRSSDWRASRAARGS